MPRTDFKYEEFEGLLASWYLTFKHLADSQSRQDVSDFRELHYILRGFATRHYVQYPDEAVANVRARTDWGKPKTLSRFSTIDMLGSFYRDFGVGSDAEDAIQVRRMSEVLKRILSRPDTLPQDTIE